MLILGVDPGLNTTGYGLLEATKNGFILKDAGAIKTKRSDALSRRLGIIYSAMAEIIERRRPDCLVLEKLFAHYRHPVTAALLGHARGIICMLAEQKHIAFFEYAATQVKRLTTGSGHASKQQMQKMVEHVLSSQQGFERADITDALALAMAHAYIKRSKI